MWLLIEYVCNNLSSKSVPNVLLSFPLFFQDAFVELYGQQRDSMFHPVSYLTKVLGLAALGLAGVTIGAFFAQKWRVFSPNYLTFSACLSSSAYQSIFQRRTAPLSPAPVPFKDHHWSDALPATGAAALTLFHPLWSEENAKKKNTEWGLAGTLSHFDYDARHCHVQLHSHGDRHTKHLHTRTLAHILHMTYFFKKQKKKVLYLKFVTYVRNKYKT